MARYGDWEGPLSSKTAVYPAPRIQWSIIATIVKTFKLVTSPGHKQWPVPGQVKG